MRKNKVDAKWAIYVTRAKNSDEIEFISASCYKTGKTFDKKSGKEKMSFSWFDDLEDMEDRLNWILGGDPNRYRCRKVRTDEEGNDYFIANVYA